MFCRWCGNEMDDGSRFCPCCGGEVKQAGGHKKKKRKKQRHLTVILTMILLVLSGLTGVGIFLIKEQLQANPTDQISEELTTVIAPYLNDNGAFDDDPDQLTKAAKQVYAYAQSLEEKGTIRGSSYCEEGYSVAFFLKDGTTTVYLPEIEGYYSGAEEEDFCVMTSNQFVDEKLSTTLAAKWYDSDPTKTIREEFVNSRSAIYDHTMTVDRLKTVFGSLKENDVRVIFWKGHGGIYTAENGETVFNFLLGEDVSDQSNERYREDRNADGTDIPRVVTMLNGKGIRKYAITYKFVEQYMCQNTGGLFFTVSCNAAADGQQMARTILEKGFETYVGSSDVVQMSYGNMLVEEVAKNLCEKDENGLYKTISDALSEAEKSLRSRTRLDRLGLYITDFAQLYGQFVVVQALDFEFRLVDNSKIYCTITSEDGTVDLEKLSVKAVRTDKTHETFDSRISGAKLVEQEGCFLICNLETDESCAIDISYGSSLFKRVSIDKVTADTRDLTVDLSLAYLDVIVQDQSGQFLDDASVRINGKIGDSGVPGLIQDATLTVNETGERVYRLPVVPGTYYVSVTEGDSVLAKDEEVRVTGNITRIYKRTDLEKQIRILADTSSVWSNDDIFWGWDSEQRICWISDYDQNGLLEVNLADTQGTGIFTIWSCFEVNEAMDGVTQVTWDTEQYAPDNFSSLNSETTEYEDLQRIDGYYDAATGNYYYAMYDVLRAGWAFNGTTYYAMSKTGSTLNWTELGMLSNETDDNGVTNSTYSAGGQSVGSREALYAAMRAQLSDKRETQYVISRFRKSESTDLYADLLKSAQAFQITLQ